MSEKLKLPTADEMREALANPEFLKNPCGVRCKLTFNGKCPKEELKAVRWWWEHLPLIDKANIIDYKRTDYKWESFNETDKAIIIAHKRRVR